MREEPVSEAEAHAIIAEWARLHDLQAGLSAFIPIIAREGFYMEFGGKRWEGYAGFEVHQLVKRRFFDESHRYSDFRITPGLPATRAKTFCNWEAHYRPENSPRSRMIKTLIDHDWEFRREGATGRPFMQGHVVTKFEYVAGFAPDDAQDYDPHLDAKWSRR